MRCCVRWLFVAPFVMASSSFAQPFHTSPACWKEPRTFHAGPVWERLPNRRSRITLDRTNIPLPQEVTYSPNKAYAVHVNHPDMSQPRPWTVEVLVYTERAYLVRIQFSDIHRFAEAKWINEKLLFLRVWWGRVAGTDFIVDVERETVLYEEMVEWGGIAFQQFQQCKSETWKDQEQCKCYEAKE